jgi:tetratricopeptide (TPR) repeat protein
LLEDRQWEEAESNLRKAVAINQARLPEGHPATAQLIANLANMLHNAYRMQKEHVRPGDSMTEALELQAKALESDIRTFGEDSLDAALRSYGYARMLWTLGRLDEAEPTLRRTLQIIWFAHLARGYSRMDPKVVLDDYALRLKAKGWEDATIEHFLKLLLMPDEREQA